MKCLTILEPWASGIVFGRKRIENRGWRTTHRGPLLIHAGLSRRYLDGTDPVDWQDLLPGLRSFDGLHFGHIVGVADITDCVSVADVAGRPFAEGPVCWLLDNVRPVAPIPYKGQQLIYDVPDHLLPAGVA